MADTKITALAAITTVDPAADVLPIVDISDTSMAASGTTKKITSNQILGAGGTATLASATITGAATAASLTVTGSSIPTNGLYLPTTNTLEFAANSLAQYRIAPLGVFSWFDGAGGTRMTLNSTGLGVGATPSSYKLTVAGTGYFSSTLTLDGASRLSAAGTNALNLNTNSVDRVTIDSSGNVGVGVTPSAWGATNQFKALQINNRGAYVAATSNVFSTAPFLYIGNNAWYDDAAGYFKYVTANTSAQYLQSASSHLWYTAASGSANAQITDFATAKMTLDASGNLILLSSNTPATLTTNGQLTVNATSNTNLRFSYRGSDGTTRTADITLA